MKPKTLSCSCGLRPNVFDEETFERELALCKQLNCDNDGCCSLGRSDEEKGNLYQ